MPCGQKMSRVQEYSKSTQKIITINCLALQSKEFADPEKFDFTKFTVRCFVKVLFPSGLPFFLECDLQWGDFSPSVTLLVHGQNLIDSEAFLFLLVEVAGFVLTL